MFKPPFNVSTMEVGLHTTQGAWFEVRAAQNKLVCSVYVKHEHDLKHEEQFYKDVAKAREKAEWICNMLTAAYSVAQ